jgi:hypothetical protein
VTWHAAGAGRKERAARMHQIAWLPNDILWPPHLPPAAHLLLVPPLGPVKALCALLRPLRLAPRGLKLLLEQRLGRGALLLPVSVHGHGGAAGACQKGRKVPPGSLQWVLKNLTFCS